MGSPARELLSGSGLIAVIGVFTADGNGNGSEVETISFNGEISQGVPFTVTYTVNADCTGSFVSTGPDGICLPQRFRD